MITNIVTKHKFTYYSFVVYYDVVIFYGFVLILAHIFCLSCSCSYSSQTEIFIQLQFTSCVAEQTKF